jgi:multicomponent Na+:H+ antiporter subunit D
MSAGSVLYATGKRKCTDLGGLFRTMPLTTVCGAIGALAISSFPLTSGFVSKSMISQAAGDEHLLWIWLALAAATAGVFLHAGIKFPWFVFFQKDSGLRPPEPPLNMRLAMILFAALCIGLGIFYQPLYALLPYGTGYVPYTGAHVVVQLELLLFSGLAFFVMLPMLRRTLTITLDVDWVYRKFAPALVSGAGVVLREALQALGAARAGAFRSVATGARALHGPQALFARTWTTGSMALWVALMLAGYLLVVYL